MKIAFYAPMKAPDHPVPSGDRRMARLLIDALASAGHRVEVVSDFRSFEPTGDADRQRVLRDDGRRLAQDLCDRLTKNKPDLWFTYHVYYKAPDWLGPTVTSALRIPYLIAEPSFAPKRAGGAWNIGHKATAEAIAAAAALFCITRLDMDCVAPLAAASARLIHLPPFLDAAPFITAGAGRAAARARLAAHWRIDGDCPWLLTVAMMRDGDKLASYQELGQALARLQNPNWRLVVVGDGPARAAVGDAMRGIERQVHYAGQAMPDALPDIYAAADLYVWPAVGEAYGMAMLEAQAAGTPVVAADRYGVGDVVRHGETGLLTPDGDIDVFAAAIDRLLGDAARRRALGLAAASFVARERTVAAAAARIDAVIGELCR